MIKLTKETTIDLDLTAEALQEILKTAGVEVPDTEPTLTTKQGESEDEEYVDLEGIRLTWVVSEEQDFGAKEEPEDSSGEEEAEG